MDLPVITIHLFESSKILSFSLYLDIYPTNIARAPTQRGEVVADGLDLGLAACVCVNLRVENLTPRVSVAAH